jgi:small subunit ribosomal protein S16
MLKIRLKRAGRKNSPFYKIVVLENLSKRDGKTFDEIGYYNPITKETKIDQLKLKTYLNNGANTTDTVRHLIYKSLIS